MKNTQAEKFYLHIALIVNQTGLGLWKDTIKPEMFTDANLGSLYASMLDNLNAGQPCDAVAMSTKHIADPKLLSTV